MKTTMYAIIKKDFRGLAANRRLFIALLIVPLILTIVLPSIFLITIHFIPDDPDIMRLLDLLPETSRMAAVLPRRLSIDRKSLTAAGTGDLPNHPAVNLIQMGVPPFVPALVRAELLFLPAGILRHRRSAAKALMLVRSSDRLILFLCVPAAEGFYCIF